MHPKDADGMANSIDPHQTASSEAFRSWSALFAETYLSQYIEFVRYLLMMHFIKSMTKIVNFLTAAISQETELQWTDTKSDFQMSKTSEDIFEMTFSYFSMRMLYQDGSNEGHNMAFSW